MKLGRAFELFVKHLLICVGFTEIKSDGIYVFDGAAGQMLQGLGEAHNADVLLEPPVQTPFYSLTRLLIECKDYQKKVGLGTVRSVVGLKEDINHFDIVDINELINRRRQNRHGKMYDYERYSYQVAIAALNGYTMQAQNFASTYRIPLIEFDRMPFWNDFCLLLGFNLTNNNTRDVQLDVTESQVVDFSKRIGQQMALALSCTGQMLFLYRIEGDSNHFSKEYSLHWSSPEEPWVLRSGNCSYCFQLPKGIMKTWLTSVNDELEMKKSAINCKAEFFSNMVVYYTENGCPNVRMIAIDKYQLEEARKNLE